MKNLLTLVALVTLVPPILSASVPLSWIAETSVVFPAAFDAFHGESLAFEAALTTYGKPLEIVGEPSIFWQTNGMGSAYWSAPASASNNVLRASFTPEMDVGARNYTCFIGVPGSVYHAAFSLRLRDSPGATPSELPLPVKVIDFAKVVVTNAPYYTQSEIDAALAEKQDLLISGNNIKTINGQSVLGAGNIAIEGGGSSTNVIWTGSALKTFSGSKTIGAGDVGAYTKAQTDSAISTKANLEGGNIFYGDQWIAGALNVVMYGIYFDRNGAGNIWIDGSWNNDYFDFTGTKRFLIRNGLDFSSTLGASRPTIDGVNIATVDEISHTNATFAAEVLAVKSGTSGPSWYRSDDWAVSYDQNATILSNRYVNSTTSPFGCVYSNIVKSVVYQLASKLSTYSLDPYSMIPPPTVSWEVDSPAATISNSTIYASIPGVYRVSAVATNDASIVRAADVPIAQRRDDNSVSSFYIADTQIADSWVKAVNDEWLTDFRALTNDGVIRHRVYDNIEYDYKFWQFGGNTKILSKFSNHRFTRHLISPRVCCTADHYGDLIYNLAVTATYYDTNGVAHSFSSGGTGKNSAFSWNLGDWARSHGWTDAEVKEMCIDDIAMLISTDGRAADSSSCPYFISEELWNRHFGSSGNGLMGWGSTQGYTYTQGDKRKDAYPVNICSDISGMISWAGAGYIDTSIGWSNSTASTNSVARCRADIRAEIDAHGSNADYWLFPPLYTGDSGTPIYIKKDGKFILVSDHTTISSGCNFIKALPVIRKFCDEQVRAALGVAQGDTLKEITD